jgi:undecaprenyl diphosphate synthase
MTAGAPAHPDNNFHVAIIMDGNGRWAERQGLPRQAGHRKGAQSVRRIVEAAPSLGINILTLFAFSGDNWRRPVPEITTLMRIFEEYLSTERQAWQTTGIRVNVVGRRDQLSPSLRREAEVTEAATARNRTMQLRIAIDYSARDAIVEAARRFVHQDLVDTECERLRFGHLLSEVMHVPEPTRDIDLLIRTGGEERLSDCLLWEIAYAEMIFVDRMWPDFTAADLAGAVAEFRNRERRFGQVRSVTPATASSWEGP